MVCCIEQQWVSCNALIWRGGRFRKCYSRFRTKLDLLYPVAHCIACVNWLLAAVWRGARDWDADGGRRLPLHARGRAGIAGPVRRQGGSLPLAAEAPAIRDRQRAGGALGKLHADAVRDMRGRPTVLRACSVIFQRGGSGVGGLEGPHRLASPSLNAPRCVHGWCIVYMTPHALGRCTHLAPE